MDKYNSCCIVENCKRLISGDECLSCKEGYEIIN